MVIVAAVDKSERRKATIEEAESLAIAFDETVHVVHVLTRSEFVELGSIKADKGETIDMEQVREVARETALEAADGMTVPHEAVGLMGQPAPRLVDYADQNDARYIVVSGRKRSPTGKVLFGSTTQSILLNANCPVVSMISRAGN